MGNFILVDTDILIDVARDDSVAIQRIKYEESKANLQISVITQMELIIGCHNRTELKTLYNFLKRFTIINVSELISEHAVELLSAYRLSHGLHIPDAIIALTAIVNNIPFLSKNQKDYRFINGLINLAKYRLDFNDALIMNLGVNRLSRFMHRPACVGRSIVDAIQGDNILSIFALKEPNNLWPD
jgi:predicted nucleic acid-binding protein